MRREGGTDGRERERERERETQGEARAPAQRDLCPLLRATSDETSAKHGPLHNVISAQCSEYQCDETQPSTGIGLALRVGHRGPYSDA